MTIQATENGRSVAATIKHFEPLIAEALPKHLDPTRFTRLALTSLRKNPQLQRCNPESFIGALLTASALGLEPDVNGECYLVPYKGECTLIIGYQGVSKLFWTHPMSDRLSAEYVCQNDHFEFRKGTDPYIDHKPAIGERGPVIAYYAIVGLKNGAVWFDVFTPAQIAKLRGPVRKGGIADPEHWMERKTALKQTLKLAPKATTLGQIQALDEKPGSIQQAVQVAQVTQAVEAPAPASQQVEQIDAETGEVLDSEIVDESQVDPWADQMPGGAA